MTRCLPLSGAIGGGYYADSSCTEALGYVACGRSRYFGGSIAGCKTGAAIYRGGVKVSESYGRTTSGTCGARTGQSGDSDLWTVKEKLAPTEFVAFRDDQRPLKGGRLAAVYRVGEDGSEVWDGHVWDAQHKAMVAPMLAADGKVRWLPEEGDAPFVIAGAFASFADASCSQPLASVIPCHDEAPLALLPRLLDITTCAPQPARAFPRLGPATDRYGTSNGTCEKLSASPDAIRLGPELSPTAFVEAKEATTGGARIRLRSYAVEGVVVPAPLEARGDVFDGPHGLCRFRVGPDGVLRCLPSGIDTTTYADASCTVPIYVPRTCAQVQPNMLVATYGPPCGAQRAWRVGAPSTYASTWTLYTSGRCGPATANVKGYALAEQDVVDFVEAKIGP